ncbi:formimidoylglutamate deiminase [Nocardiopsis terrae]|uniref:Formiminoglutamate deiminase n=1 Tax=Nocardiopsis terrae TaxID=372655 RepID=A0ABR9HER7_9ACTN|nr:formimidoylglutamate deiminase [Nocardiopsis terrae]MBE1457499.1 formiminoglutamate deiminase [Nocardiopsis terrae]GHC85808.1 formimidoylglutamate deiminase [Nocardiopsis terrae]
MNARSRERRYWCERAWLGGDAPEPGVLLTVDARGRLASVAAADTPPADAERLTGLTLPGMANAHSHAFHRALRGRTHTGGGSFWTWRELMYRVAERLDPDSYHRLARAVFAEMALAGVVCVGEFHYLHHGPGGHRYTDPNAMGHALVAAAADAGVRLTLLDVCYLSGGLGEDGAHLPLAGPQLRFGDGTVGAWADRVAAFTPRGAHARTGAAAHSVRAVPAADLPRVAEFADGRGLPLHVHVSEQPAENAACLAAHGLTPVRVLAEAGALTERTTLVHATHLTDADVDTVREHGSAVCLCPTTERDLADGLPRTGDLVAAPHRVPLSLGTDQHVQSDLFEEARAVELHERLRTHRRGTLGSGALLRAATTAGHAGLGWHDAGALLPGARADLVNVSLDSVRLAGADPERATDAVVFAATAADVRHVMVDGEWTVRDGAHTRLPDTASELDSVIKELL